MGRLQSRFWRAWPRRLSFTREGKVVVLVSVGLGVAAVNTGNNLIYLVFSLSLALILLSGILSEANLRGLRCHPIGFLRVPARETIPIRVTVESRRKRFAAYSIEARPLFDSADVVVEPARFLQVRPNEVTSATCRVTFAHRGDHVLRGMEISTTFPFSFFRKALSLPVGPGSGRHGEDWAANRIVRVHPRVRDIVAWSLARAPEGEDEHRSVAGRGTEFFGVRDYRPGDHPRWILYRRSATRLTPVVREVEDQGVRSVWIALLNATSGDRPVSVWAVEDAIERAASLVVAFLRRGFVVGLSSASSQVSPGTGPAQMERVLDELALLPVLIGGRDDVALALARATPPADGSQVIWVTPDSDATPAAGVG